MLISDWPKLEWSSRELRRHPSPFAIGPPERAAKSTADKELVAGVELSPSWVEQRRPDRLEIGCQLLHKVYPRELNTGNRTVLFPSL